MRLGLGYSVQFAIIDTYRQIYSHGCKVDDNRRHSNYDLQVLFRSTFLSHKLRNQMDNLHHSLQLGLNSLFNHGGLTHKTLGQTWKYLYIS